MKRILLLVLILVMAAGQIIAQETDHEQLVRKIYDTKDAAERLEQIDAYLALEGRTPRMDRYVYRAYFMTLKAEEDYNALEAILPEYITAVGATDGAEAAQTYNEIASAFTPSLKHLDLASGYARRALEIISGITAPPEGVSAEEWPGIKTIFTANIKDTLGYILFRDMEYKEAALLLSEAAAVIEDNGEIRMHYGMALEKTGDFKLSYENLLYAKYLGIKETALEDSLTRVGKKAFTGWEKTAFENKVEDNVKTMIRKKALADEITLPAESFTLSGLDGKSVALKDLKGKVVLLDFWATWCGPCNLEMPVLERIYREYRERGVVVVAVSVDGEQTRDKVPGFVKERNLTLKVLKDDGKVSASYKVRGIPALFIIDVKGNIRFKHVGFSEDLYRNLKAQVEYLLGE